MKIFVFWLCTSVLFASACVVLTKWLARRSPWLRWTAATLTAVVLTIASFGLSSSGASNESITDLIPYQQIVRASHNALRGGTYPTFSLLLIAWMGLLTILISVLLFIGLRSNPLSGKHGRATFWNLRRFGFASATAIIVGATALAIEDWVVRSLLRVTLAREESLLQQRQLLLDSVPLSDDAAPAYRRLGVTSRDVSVANEWLAYGASIDFHKHVTPEQLTEFLAKSQNSLDALNVILQCPRVSMLTVQSLEDDGSINLTALAARLLIARCREKFDQGRSDDGWSDFLALGRIAEHAAQVPSLPMHVARMNCWNAQSDLLETLLAEGHIPSEAVARANESESIDGSDSMVAAIEVAFPEILADYCRTRLGIVPAQPAKRPWTLSMLSFPLPVLDRLFLSKDEITGTFSLMAEVMRAARQPFENRLNVFHELSQAQMRNQIWPFGQKFPFYGRIVNREVPTWASAAEFTLLSSVRRALQRIAIGCTRFRKRVGQWPTSVEELIPTDVREVPLDSFNRQPIRIRIDADSIVIFSVGPDGVDDSGYEDDRESPSWGKDITFRIGRRQSN